MFWLDFSPKNRALRLCFRGSFVVTGPCFENHLVNDIPLCITFETTFMPLSIPPSPFLSALFRCKSCQSGCWCEQQPNTYSSEWFFSQPAGGILGQRREQLRLVLSRCWKPCLSFNYLKGGWRNSSTYCWVLDRLPVTCWKCNCFMIRSEYKSHSDC